jgi:hypothetical protein
MILGRNQMRDYLIDQRWPSGGASRNQIRETRKNSG